MQQAWSLQEHHAPEGRPRSRLGDEPATLANGSMVPHKQEAAIAAPTGKYCPCNTIVNLMPGGFEHTALEISWTPGYIRECAGLD